MSLRRRLALVAWARSSQGWIIEDAYDSEFRYAGPPLTALVGIDMGDGPISQVPGCLQDFEA